ncbi:hypothetical protein P344_04640 [Spiroplasma mirum ATCC 29335]|uniref:Uncharacterized protein n=1 Tax=Spiroplasma mirum ATCC 29335 TaxID=838561 RepID=W6ANH1_9MOLU|nr:hypothetical protein [Spiroplasma atrichopogonis]AHI58250.1 hypothetical protein P344_04640 [Spiroplasma mirum ATCC 29335]
MDSKSLEAEIGCLLAKMKGKEIYFILLASFIFLLGGEQYMECVKKPLRFIPLLCHYY